MKRVPKKNILLKIPFLKGILQPLKEKILKKRWLKYVWGDPSRPVKEGMVNVYYFKWHNEDNVGDLLSIVTVNFVKEKLKLKDTKKDKTVRMFAIGSVIHAAKSDMVIWGSGIRNSQTHPPHVNFDIRAVRGPLTRRRMMDNGFECPEIYGDPALLMPIFYNPKIEKRYDYTIIPHYYKEDDIPSQYRDKMISTFTSDWKGFIDRIVASEYVISSSLHGLILAEVYGVPAILYDVENDVFKYEDYFQGTGRTNIPIAESLEFAIQNRPATVPIPNIEKNQQNLLESFPKDLWY
ncbi:polysaccharide pyruvyl transferase family protein [Pedobacter chinensis]|uniref:Polysaccharide pyruvyl transferase family protein n=1 Tax=Pedobacter chinensis TaxID=2282421 RepID=A0A369PU72_9SPHI|nr:polysaccharide pyruvyl transferase family protein [Pedobacter chinensis]RDC54269.1 polysaccharide pyruvyl transferase family protein [Pedobacter chinensis]